MNEFLTSLNAVQQVNGTEMSGKSQTDAVAILRDVRVGGTVDLVVSRQADGDQSPDLMTKDEDGQRETTGPETSRALTVSLTVLVLFVYVMIMIFWTGLQIDCSYNTDCLI